LRKVLISLNKFASVRRVERSWRLSRDHVERWRLPTSPRDAVSFSPLGDENLSHFGRLLKEVYGFS
jgi:hypothetical protein